LKLIRKLGTKLDKNNHLQSFGLYLCPFCLQEVEKRLGDGEKCKSCGCHKNIKHAGFGTKLYDVWASMKQRILNPKNKRFKDYGGRGIIICPEWTDMENGFINFKDWSLSNGYIEGLTINRIDNNGNYEPNNCNWITNKENNRNTRRSKVTLEKANEIRELYKTGDYTQRILAVKYNIQHSNIFNIINNKNWV